MVARRSRTSSPDEWIPFGLVAALTLLTILVSFAAGSWLGWISRAFF